MNTIAPSRHSSVVGGSTAARLVNCPGSVALLDLLPKEVQAPSPYADEGSDLHTLLAALIDNDLERNDNDRWPVAGETVVNGTLITAELMRDCIEPCWSFWEELREGADEYAVEVEAAFPGIAGAFGTCDLAVRYDSINLTRLTDWKFGAGHSVYAFYPDPDDSDYLLINEQLLFYACCLRHAYPQWFPKDVRIVVNIVQPRSQDVTGRISEIAVDNEVLDDFEREMILALHVSKRPEAPQKIGPWCRFAACKPLCPLHNAPLLDISLMPGDVLVGDPDVHQPAIERILSLAPVAEALIAEARRQALELLLNGRHLDGWKLVSKGTRRRWNQDETMTLKALRKLGLGKAEVTELVVKTPAQIEKLLPKGAALPIGLAAAPIGGPTLAPAADKRPAFVVDDDSLHDLMRIVAGQDGASD